MLRHLGAVALVTALLYPIVAANSAAPATTGANLSRVASTVGQPTTLQHQLWIWIPGVVLFGIGPNHVSNTGRDGTVRSAGSATR